MGECIYRDVSMGKYIMWVSVYIVMYIWVSKDNDLMRGLWARVGNMRQVVLLLYSRLVYEIYLCFSLI